MLVENEKEENHVINDTLVNETRNSSPVYIRLEYKLIHKYTIALHYLCSRDLAILCSGGERGSPNELQDHLKAPKQSDERPHLH